MPKPPPDPAADDAASREAAWLDVLAGVYDDRRHARAVDPSRHARRHPERQQWLERELARLAAAAAPHDASVAARGATIGGFRLVRELGRGGQAVVYEAIDPALRRSVALKVVRPGPALLTSALERFAREAELAARLDDPG